jgi:hypothetical protein
MSRGLFVVSLILFIAAGSRAGEKYQPITEKQLQTNVPNFFYFDYQNEPEPGKRLWLRIDDKTWIERYPSGKESKFQTLGRATVEKVEGIIVERTEDNGLHVFIPDKGGEKMEIKFREAAKDGDWSLLGEMKKVE